MVLLPILRSSEPGRHRIGQRRIPAAARASGFGGRQSRTRRRHLHSAKSSSAGHGLTRSRQLGSARDPGEKGLRRSGSAPISADSRFPPRRNACRAAHRGYAPRQIGAPAAVSGSSGGKSGRLPPRRQFGGGRFRTGPLADDFGSAESRRHEGSTSARFAEWLRFGPGRIRGIPNCGPVAAWPPSVSANQGVRARSPERWSGLERSERIGGKDREFGNEAPIVDLENTQDGVGDLLGAQLLGRELPVVARF